MNLNLLDLILQQDPDAAAPMLSPDQVRELTQQAFALFDRFPKRPLNLRQRRRLAARLSRYLPLCGGVIARMLRAFPALFHDLPTNADRLERHQALADRWLRAHLAFDLLASYALDEHLQEQAQVASDLRALFQQLCAEAALPTAPLRLRVRGALLLPSLTRLYRRRKPGTKKKS